MPEEPEEPLVPDEPEVPDEPDEPEVPLEPDVPDVPSVPLSPTKAKEQRTFSPLLNGDAADDACSFIFIVHHAP